MSKGRVCLAYSGGLDTSCILKWLVEEDYEVIGFLANVGQDEDRGKAVPEGETYDPNRQWEEIRQKALSLGAKDMVITDLRKEFVEDLCFRAIQCNAVYEDRYLLGTSLARPVIARAQIEVAKKYNCQYVSHGCTGKGNDQVRFELAFYALEPTIKVIAPWRDPVFYKRFPGRQALLDYAAEKGIPVAATKGKPWSMDENLAHCSYEAGILEDPSLPAPKGLWVMTDDPETAPEEPAEFTIHFEKGIPTKVVVHSGSEKKEITGSVELFIALNQIGKIHGVGRIDIVENRFIGLKSRGCYDSPAMTILRLAHVDLEGLVLDGHVRALRDQFVTHNWSQLLYNGLYFSPERDFIENSVLYSQRHVNGEVTLRCYKGSVGVLSRKSDTEKLYDETEASMDTLEDFQPDSTTGFIDVMAIRLKKYKRSL